MILMGKATQPARISLSWLGYWARHQQICSNVEYGATNFFMKMVSMIAKHLAFERGF
jgi:hypothetical protein